MYIHTYTHNETQTIKQTQTNTYKHEQTQTNTTKHEQTNRKSQQQPTAKPIGYTMTLIGTQTNELNKISDVNNVSFSNASNAILAEQKNYVDGNRKTTKVEALKSIIIADNGDLLVRKETDRNKEKIKRKKH